MRRNDLWKVMLCCVIPIMYKNLRGVILVNALMKRYWAYTDKPVYPVKTFDGCFCQIQHLRSS